MKRGEEIKLEELWNFTSDELKIAIGLAMSGKNVYLMGPPGSGKTAMLRKIGITLHKIYRNPLYIKLEWIKYKWNINDYIKNYGIRHIDLMGYLPNRFDVALLDDVELAIRYPSIYERIIDEVYDKQKVCAVRDEVHAEDAISLLGDGIVVDLKGRRGEPVAKIPLGFNFIGTTKEIEVI